MARSTEFMFALATNQDTAMPETALCGDCVLSGSNKGRAQGAAGMAPDWNGAAQMVDCSENDQLACLVCGAST